MGIDPVTHKPFSHLMAEIATTLASPQVAHFAEAALSCFKDEMPGYHDQLSDTGRASWGDLSPLVGDMKHTLSK